MTRTDRRRFPVLFAAIAALAATALLALFGSLLLPATVQAQDSDEVLLSNTGQEWEAGAGTNDQFHNRFWPRVHHRL